MKQLASIAVLLLLATTGCENARSHLDQVAKAPPAGASAAPVAVEADHSGDVEARLRRLEDSYAKNSEALDFLNKVYAQQKQQQQAQQREEHAPDAVFAVDVSADIKLGQVDGPPTALVTVVKAFDFACPYCQKVSATMDELVKDYGGKVRVVYKNMVVHPQIAMPAHLASCAAAKQGKYLPFKNGVWEKGFLAYASARDPSKLGEENLLAIAKDVGLDVAKLKTDMASEECKAFVSADMAELAKFHVNSTPTFFINGKHVGGALDKGGFKQIIDERLKEAESSGVSGAEYYDKVVMAKGEKQFRSAMDPKPN